MAAMLSAGRSCGVASCSYPTQRCSVAAPMRAPRARRSAASRAVCAGMKPDKAQAQLQELLATHTQRLERLLRAAPPAAQLHRELSKELRHLKQALAAAAPQAASASTALADALHPRDIALALQQDLAQLQQGLAADPDSLRRKTDSNMGDETGNGACMGDESSSSSSSSSEDEEERMQRKQEKKQRKLTKQQQKMEKKAAKLRTGGRDVAACATAAAAAAAAATTSASMPSRGSNTALAERPPPAAPDSAPATAMASSSIGGVATGAVPPSTAVQLPLPQLWDDHDPSTSAPAQLPEGALGRVLVCQGSKCTKVGAHGVLQEASRAVADAPGVEVLPCKCLGKCKMGPAMRVRPQGHKGVTFTRVAPGQVGGFVEQAFATAALEAAAAEAAAAGAEPVAKVDFTPAAQNVPVF